MPIKLRELAERIGATVHNGDPDLVIDGAASLAEAGPAHLSPFTDPRYLPQLQKTAAGAVIVKNETPGAGVPPKTAVLWSADPEMSFVRAIGILYPESQENTGIDSRAVVEPGAEIAAGAYVGPFAVVRAGTKVGANSRIMPHAVIGRSCVLGEGCCIHPHAVLYDNIKLGHRVTIHSGAIIGADGFGYKFRDGRHQKVPQIGNVEIGDDVEIGANTCIDRGALGPTRVGFGSKIDNLVQIGHNVRIGKHCILCGQAAMAGSSGMDDYAILGGNVGVADHIFLGKGARAGAKSGIGKDVPPGQEVWGLFAEERKAVFKQYAALRRLPELLERVREIEKRLLKNEKEPERSGDA